MNTHNAPILDEPSFAAKLPDGSTVNIATKEGANKFLTEVSNFNHFSSNLKQLRKLRKKKSLNQRQQKQIDKHFDFIYLLAVNADSETFTEKIPQSEIQDWVNYTIEEVKNLTKNKYWIRTGDLVENDLNVLRPCLPLLTTHTATFNVASESEFFKVLANFIKARKGNGRALPTAYICDIIGNIVYGAIHGGLSGGWCDEKIFEKLEASGFLQQSLRCATVANHSAFSLQWWDKLFIGLECCFCIRKLKDKEPCGITLREILSGQDGSPDIQPGTLATLQGLARLSDIVDSPQFKAITTRGIYCAYCHKIGNSKARLSYCSKCHSTDYCSTECQHADWEKHKHICGETSVATRDRAFLRSLEIHRFMKDNFQMVLEEMDKVCNSTGVKTSDLAVELNFVPDENHIVPALNHPPMINIGPIDDYVSGERVPEWYHRARLVEDLMAEEGEDTFVSASGVLLVHHANRTHVDKDTIDLYRRPDSRMKLCRLFRDY